MTAPTSPTSRIPRMILAAMLLGVAGCGGTVDPPDTAEVVKDSQKPATPPTPEAPPAPDATPAKDAPKN
jgi:hypothetical protein